MSGNRGVVYTKPGEVQVQDIADPKFENPQGRRIEHGVILKVVSTNICGSDQHMVRGRTSAPAGMVLGHEITGEVIEKGSDVEMIELGDLVSVPFNVACGRCRTCRETNTGVCLTVNPGRAGGAYGYVDMGGWIGGQARYVMVPYADFNLLKFPDRDKALSRIMDLTMLTDILPTGFHGALTAGVKPGSTVYVAGAGPVGLAAAASAQLLGAAVIMIGDMNEARLSHARKVGFVPIDLTKHDRLGEQVAAVVGEPTVDSVIDAVGFEAKGHGGGDQPAIVLNQAMEIIRPAGAIGIPGLYVTEDPGAHDEAANNRRTGLLAHVCSSPRVRNWRTLGSCDSAKSTLGSPSAIIVLLSGSRKTELVPMAKILANSCVTTTIVAPRLSRNSTIRSSSSFELIGSSPADGSSKKRISGSRAMARASPARFCIPPLISDG